MIKNLFEKKEENEQGFTLIELMVVVLIIAILLAIAIPTFLGARNTANARAAEANLRNALTAESTYYTNNNQVYGNAAGVGAIETAITFVDTNNVSPTGASPAQNQVDIVTAAAHAAPATPWVDVELIAAGKDGNCYYVDNNNGLVQYGKGPQVSSNSLTCTTTEPAMSTSPQGANW